MCPCTPLTKYYVPFSKTHSSFIYKKAVWPIWKKKLRKSSKMLPKCEKWENHTFQKYTVHVLWEQAVNLFEIKTSLLALWIWNIFLANYFKHSACYPWIQIIFNGACSLNLKINIQKINRQLKWTMNQSLCQTFQSSCKNIYVILHYTWLSGVSVYIPYVYGWTAECDVHSVMNCKFPDSDNNHRCLTASLGESPPFYQSRVCTFRGCSECTLRDLFTFSPLCTRTN